MFFSAHLQYTHLQLCLQSVSLSCFLIHLLLVAMLDKDACISTHLFKCPCVWDYRLCDTVPPVIHPLLRDSWHLLKVVESIPSQWIAQNHAGVFFFNQNYVLWREKRNFFVLLYSEPGQYVTAFLAASSSSDCMLHWGGIDFHSKMLLKISTKSTR